MPLPFFEKELTERKSEAHKGVAFSAENQENGGAFYSLKITFCEPWASLDRVKLFG
jgi:hypothetical protein